jgi:Domain of unknown function (DUF4389)
LANSGFVLDPPLIRVVVRDPDLRRSRLTVGFRLLLALPHLVWLAGWFSLATLVSIANWIATLFSGKPAPMFARFLSAYIRYAVQVAAYVSLAANPFPGFTGRPGSYPVEAEIGPLPERQNRWITGFRFLLALPAILLADVLLGYGSTGAGGAGTQIGGVVSTVAFLGWFVGVFRARTPRGFRDLAVYGIGYSAQVLGYVFLLTDRYPDSNPAPVYRSVEPDPPSPVQLTVSDDLRRSRLTTFFRLVLAVPHLVWLTLWGIATLFAVIGNWFFMLFSGRPAAPLHRFVARFVRYQTHVYAFLQMVANPFPGFTGRPGSYPIDLELPAPEQQSRVVTGFRLFLALPAFAVSSALGTVAGLAAVYSWFHALIRGQVPRGLRNLGAFSLRYNAQVVAYTGLVTDRYPYSGPIVGSETWQLRLEDEPPPETA